MLAPLTLHAAKRPMPSAQTQQEATIKPASTKQLRGEVLFRAFLGDIPLVFLMLLGMVIPITFMDKPSKTTASPKMFRKVMGLFLILWVVMPVLATLSVLTIHALTSVGTIHRIFKMKLVKRSGASASVMQRLLYPLYHSFLPILTTICITVFFAIFFRYHFIDETAKNPPNLGYIMVGSLILSIIWCIAHVTCDLIIAKKGKTTSTSFTNTTLVSTA